MTRCRHAPLLLVGLVLALTGCKADDSQLDGVVADIEAGMEERIVPILQAEGPDAENLFATVDTVLRDARTEHLHVVRGSAAGSSEGADGSHVELVVTIVGADRGECLAVRAASAGEVRSVPVSGDPASNCSDAEVPQDLFGGSP